MGRVGPLVKLTRIESRRSRLFQSRRLKMFGILRRMPNEGLRLDRFRKNRLMLTGGTRGIKASFLESEQLLSKTGRRSF